MMDSMIDMYWDRKSAQSYCLLCINRRRGSLACSCTWSTLPGWTFLCLAIHTAVQDIELKTFFGWIYLLFKLLQSTKSDCYTAVRALQTVVVDLEKSTHSTATKKFSISGNWVQRFKYIKFIGGSCREWSFEMFMSAEVFILFGSAAKWSNAIIQRHALPPWDGFKLLKPYLDWYRNSVKPLGPLFNWKKYLQAFMIHIINQHCWWSLKWDCLINQRVLCDFKWKAPSA